MKVLTVVGARPQFVKALPVSGALARAGHHEILVHTGQHYDSEMSQLFFEELSIPHPAHNLGVGSGSHAEQTSAMLTGVGRLLEERGPDIVLVYGDTNSTLAGALAAIKLQLPVAHVEAGLRSYNRRMPEEHNRVLTDHCSSLLFCPSTNAVRNLAREGIVEGVHEVGDVMFDSVILARALDDEPDRLGELGLSPGTYYLATVHRAENTDDLSRLASILTGLGRLEAPVFLPMHPRTRVRLEDPSVRSVVGEVPSNVRVARPVGYLDMLALQRGALSIITDSGGVQKEALWAGVPCVTIRDETEWVETVEAGWNQVVGTDPDRIVEAAGRDRPDGPPPPLYGDGHAAIEIARLIGGWVSS